MGQIFDFGDIKNNERTIRKTWDEFRAALSSGTFSYDNIEEAKKCTFLKVYNDLFHDNFGIEHSTIKLTDLDGTQVGRGCVLKKDEAPDYARFIPKKEFITADNRFSPPGVEWLYLALGNETAIHQCAQAECRTHVGDEFGFCHFKFDDAFADIKLVDLTIADNKTYEQLNQVLETYAQKQVKRGIKAAKALGRIPKYNVNKAEFKRLFTEWAVYTYSKLLSEQIFEPIDDSADKGTMYAPFQTMAQYYSSLGYSGIIYGSTVSEIGRNIVLFNKNIAKPCGAIEKYTIL